MLMDVVPSPIIHKGAILLWVPCGTYGLAVCGIICR